MSGPFDPGRRVHVMGASGAGMSALARLLEERGCRVDGCDARPGALDGPLVVAGHDPAHLAGVETLVASPAVPIDSPERRAAREAGIDEPSRAEVMAELARLAPMVGLAGTNGKTTSTQMAVHAWRAAGADPGWLVGAEVRGVGHSGHWSEGRDLLVELDESYGTFELVAPTELGLLNIERDHLDHYGTFDALRTAFARLVARTTGPVVLWADDVEATRAASGRPDAWRVGRGAGLDVVVVDERLGRTGSSFALEGRTGRLEVTLGVPGGHNVANAAVVLSLAVARGLDGSAAAAGLANFTGAPRRFEVRGTRGATTVVEDYAHLPGEVVAVVTAARASGFRRVAAVFQPHRVTRTTELAGDFARAFDGLDSLVVTGIYTAGEPNPEGVTGELFADAVRRGGAVPVTYAESLDSAAEAARDRMVDCDLMLVLGAGDVGTIVPRLLEEPS